MISQDKRKTLKYVKSYYYFFDLKYYTVSPIKCVSYGTHTFLIIKLNKKVFSLSFKMNIKKIAKMELAISTPSSKLNYA